MKLTPTVNVINVLRARFLTKFWRQSQNVTRKNAVRTKKRAINVDEIDTYVMYYYSYFNSSTFAWTATRLRPAT